jgi:hypothetical protein
MCSLEDTIGGIQFPFSGETVLQVLSSFPDNVLAVLASGEVTGEEFRDILVPAAKAKLKTNEKLSLYYQFGPQFAKMNAAAMWEDAKLDVKHWREWDRIAVIADIGWIRKGARLARMLLRRPVRVFSNAEADAARDWVMGAITLIDFAEPTQLSSNREVTYPPINTLKRVAEEVWIVDGPMIRFGPPLLKFPFPTRMTAVRLDSTSLFIHSPTPLVPSLRAEIERLGTPRWILGPNRIHYWWIPEWHAAYPAAAVYLAPGIKEQSRGRIGFQFNSLDRRSGYPWDDEIATLPIVSSYMTEVEFFHRTSRTLILTDLIENFELDKLSSRGFRWLVSVVGAASPHGGMPVDMRLSFLSHRRELRMAIETMLDWNPERVLLAHGKWFERDGAGELRRAFRWAFR